MKTLCNYNRAPSVTMFQVAVVISLLALALLGMACSRAQQSDVNTITPTPTPAPTPVQKGVTLKEIRHNTLTYGGPAGAEVTVRVEPQSTSHSVTYTLEGTTVPLLAGQKIKFNLKNNPGDRTLLQVNLEFSGAGSYDVVVENIADCIKDAQHTNECRRTRFGPQGATLNFTFVVQ